MIKVSLIAKTDEIPNNLISHAAKTCYTSDVPKMGKLIDIENSLFKTGHHTTMQHSYFTFNIDGLSISSTIFGLHLLHPFYDSDQRSGRFSKIYSNPNLEEIKQYILLFWPKCDIERISSFIQKGINIYEKNIEQATKIAENFIRNERPFANDEYIEMNAKKIAQEQMRVFLSTIFPTALDHTLNLSTISALYRSSWNPELRYIVNEMKNLILEIYPNLSFIFENTKIRETNWNPKRNLNNVAIQEEPILHNVELLLNEENLNLDNINLDAVDLRYFTPENMTNDINFIKTDIEVSLATFAQDQRHRMIKRSAPQITGNFYLPPILKVLELEKIAIFYIKEYFELFSQINENLALSIAPYGIMVKYTKVGDINAVIHEQEKRLCWSAQEEIYNLSRLLNNHLVDNKQKFLANVFCPSCYKDSCIEGRRYCGRNVSILKNDKSIPKRRI